ncbi:MAG: hypothetical protein ACMXYG_04985 [Candidatus Woesearchaeota archaeon]
MIMILNCKNIFSEFFINYITFFLGDRFFKKYFLIFLGFLLFLFLPSVNASVVLSNFNESYTQDFSSFTDLPSLPLGWYIDDYSYIGNFGSGTAGGIRGDGVLGFQLTGANDTFTAALNITNDIGLPITNLNISYLGKVARTTVGHPMWVVDIDGVIVPELEYSTAAGEDEFKTVVLTNLNIPHGSSFTVSWFTTIEGTSGIRRQIGITDVEIYAFTDDISIPILLINEINLSPSLDFSNFGVYNVSAHVNNSSEIDNVFLNISVINGDNNHCWSYYVNGSCNSNTLEYTMDYFLSDNLWKKTHIYPDDIYPEITFATSDITWFNEPSESPIWSGNYHIFNFSNPFSVVDNMAFWLEFNAVPISVNSSPLYVYIVANGSNGIPLDYFTEDWTDKPYTQLVATYSSSHLFHHTHTNNSSHFLVALSTDENGNIGINDLDLADNFLVVLYNPEVNVNSGWLLRYHDELLCSNHNAWFSSYYLSNEWSIPNNRAGCPDVHVHIARSNDLIKDGINLTISAIDIYGNTSTSFASFFYGNLTNLEPNPTSVISPLPSGIYNGILDIRWNPSFDPNNDILNYSLFLLNSDKTINESLVQNTTLLDYQLDTTEIEDGFYNLLLVVCDSEFCINSSLGNNFLINNTIQLQSLIDISFFSNNTLNSSSTSVGDSIILMFNSSDDLINTQVFFYSGGYLVNGDVDIKYINGSYVARYIISSFDLIGSISFEIIADNLDQVYTNSLVDNYVFNQGFSHSNANKIMISFDNPEFWQSGSGGLNSYQSDHIYIKDNWFFSGGPALRETTTFRNGYPGAFGNYSWRLQNETSVEWYANYTGNNTFSGFGFSVRRWNSFPEPNRSIFFSYDNSGYIDTGLRIDNTFLNDSNAWLIYNFIFEDPISFMDDFSVLIQGDDNSERIIIDDFFYYVFDEIVIINDSVNNISNSSRKVYSSNNLELFIYENCNSNTLDLFFESLSSYNIHTMHISLSEVTRNDETILINKHIINHFPSDRFYYSINSSLFKESEAYILNFDVQGFSKIEYIFNYSGCDINIPQIDKKDDDTNISLDDFVQNNVSTRPIFNEFSDNNISPSDFNNILRSISFWLILVILMVVAVFFYMKSYSKKYK